MTIEIFEGLLTLPLISDYTHVSGIYKQINVMQLHRAALRQRPESPPHGSSQTDTELGADSPWMLWTTRQRFTVDLNWISPLEWGRSLQRAGVSCEDANRLMRLRAQGSLSLSLSIQFNTLSPSLTDRSTNRLSPFTKLRLQCGLYLIEKQHQLFQITTQQRFSEIL